MLRAMMLGAMLVMAACATDGGDGGGGGDDDGSEPEDTCGDDVCDAGEKTSCAADCEAPATCGDNVCAASETATSCAADCTATLEVRNASSYNIYRVFLAPCGKAWLPNQLSSTLYPGYQFTLTTIPPGCWIVRAENSDSVYWQTPTGINLTAGQRYPWTLGN